MVVVMNIDSTPDQVQAISDKLQLLGFNCQMIRGVKRIVIGAVGEGKNEAMAALQQMPGVEKIVHIMKPYKLVSREARDTDTIVRVKNCAIGGGELTVIAGPCAVESQEQLLTAAHQVKAAGAQMLRGGAFKPRTSPYSFQGLEEEGLRILQAASQETGLPVITEVIDQRSLDMAVRYVDVLQVGARNMQNFQLLRAVGQTSMPVVLKRGMSATIEEWLMAAEYIMSEGNERVILCERGIRTFETATRNTLDLSAVPLIKRLSHLPVLVDPSHATGDRNLVMPMSLAAAASGADGIIVEMHPEPNRALSDGPQSLYPEQLNDLVQRVKAVRAVVGGMDKQKGRESYA